MIFRNIFFRTAENNHYPNDKHCCICERRLYWFTKTVRLYTLGMTRAHMACAANHLRDKLMETIKTIPRKVQ